MTIGLQGSWIVSVKTKSAAWEQRFLIEGSTNSVDGPYVGELSTSAVFVDSEQWGVTIENNPTGPVGWRPSRTRLVNFRVETGFFKVDIESDDGGKGPDEDFNDLVLTIAKPLNDSEWIVYGSAKSYKGFCLFNPCFTFPFVVIDTAEQLERLVQYPEVRSILERVYGGDITRLAEREHFKPVVLSRGGEMRAGLAVEGSTSFELTKATKARPSEAVPSDTAKISHPVTTSHKANLSAADAGIIDKVMALAPCEVNPIGSALLRLVEYDRTDAELGGGAYTGFGDRETLGVTSTDEFGNYVFSFKRSFAELLDEATSDVPVGGSAAVAARPDLIYQFVDDPEAIAVHETAPYYDVTNVQRIDLCIPAKELVPKPCRGDRVLQYLGDIPIVNNPGSTLFPDGTITNDPAISESGPAVRRGAWNGVLGIFGCFEDTVTPVKHYTIRYKAGAGSWQYLSVNASGLRQQGTGVWVSESYGPTSTPLSVGTVPAYRNIETEVGWSLEVEHRKARVDLVSLLSPDLPRSIDDVWFVIRGYDDDGNFVPGTFDLVKLRVDGERATGDIASITVPGEPDPGECAMLELPNDSSPLEIKLRALDADGFLRDWRLQAVKGSNTLVGLIDSTTAAAPAGEYPGDDLDGVRFYGTSERAGSDVDGYVVLNVSTPSGWLGTVTFCAFSFELHVRDRTTNGKTVPAARKVWDEVIGINLAG